MASLSIPQPRNFSDSQFIGDLMVLFERRKVKCGDPSSFEVFTAQLASNNALRGDLFTLCTAISHMAAQDLTGEELLALVARALAGTGVPKGSAVPEVPESMRTAFLDGYEAWSNRAALAMEEPAVWPPPRKAPAGDGSAPLSQSEPAEPKDPAEGTRTIQEALDIARERSPNGVLGMKFNTPSPNIEHLTISELKKLLEDIEDRVSRIAPHLDQKNAVSTTETTDIATPEAPIPRRAVLTFEPARPASPANSSSTTIEGAANKFDEAAFLARHAYLKPTGRTAQLVEVPTAQSQQASLNSAISETESSASAAPVDAVAEAANAPAVAAAPAVESPAIDDRTDLSKAPAEFLAGYQQDVAQISAQARLAILLSVTFFFIVVVSWGGVYVYRSMHPKTIYDYSPFKPAAPTVIEQPASEVAAPVPDTSHASPHPQTARTAASATGRSKGPAVNPQGSAASVWPPSNQASREAIIQDTQASEAASHRTSPVHVDATANGSSTTIVGFAPKPVHAEQASGVSGTVMVEVSISKQGNVTGARVISGPMELRSAALQTVQQWKFKPYLVDGVPAEVTTTLGVYVKGD